LDSNISNVICTREIKKRLCQPFSSCSQAVSFLKCMSKWSIRCS